MGTLVLQSIIIYPIPATSHPNRDNMAKVTIHCVRHAQGFHNLSLANHTIPDPLLTPHGKSQCQTLSSTFPSPSKITHLVSSPLRRTLYTPLLPHRHHPRHPHNRPLRAPRNVKPPLRHRLQRLLPRSRILPGRIRWYC